jgi:hypothetical protein
MSHTTIPATTTTLPPKPTVGQRTYIPKYGNATIIAVPSYGTIQVETDFRQVLTISGLGWKV